LLANNNGLSPDRNGLLANNNCLLANDNGLEKKQPIIVKEGKKKKKCLSGVRSRVPCSNFFESNGILTHSTTPPFAYEFKEGYAHHED
jgi:hypothetical protein